MALWWILTSVEIVLLLLGLIGLNMLVRSDSAPATFAPTRPLSSVEVCPSLPMADAAAAPPRMVRC
jgi:hypothetical protein